MFIVHSVHQLEEALKGSAKEILVTGELFGPVKEVFANLSKQADKTLAAGTSREERPIGSGGSFETREVLGLESFSVQMLTENFMVIDIEESPCCPSIKLRRNKNNKT